MDKVQPQSARSEGLKEVTAWVIESNRRWELEELGEDVDLQVDASPFVYTTKDEVSLWDQAEVFIGHKQDLEDWDPHPPNAKWIENFNILASSNQLFADYQPHCSNVFSTLDSFEYGKKKYLTSASASYYVFGWNSEERDDVLTLRGDLTRSQRLDALRAEIKGAKSDSVLLHEVQGWLDSPRSARTVCHGAMYDVLWEADEKPKAPADTFCKLLNGTMPLAVGTTPMDTLVTYAKVHQPLDPDTMGKLESYIVKLEEHLLARDDDVDALQQAQDMLYAWNYVRQEGGKHYHASANQQGKPASKPEDLTKIAQLNKQQRLVDATARRIKRLRSLLFCEWWRYVTLENPSKNRTDETTKKVGEIADKIKNLQDAMSASQTSILSVLKNANSNLEPQSSNAESLEPGVYPPFYRQRDPTLLIGGVRSGWHADYLKNIEVRLDSQVCHTVKSSPSCLEIEDPWQTLTDLIAVKIPDFQKTFKNLINEFLALQPTEPSPPLSALQQIPLFHDELALNEKNEAEWRDRWNCHQPWFPLFLEWEVEYNHLDSQYWILEERVNRKGEASKLRYSIDAKIDLAKEFKDEKTRDRRLLSGRVLILPQPNFSLQAKIDQLFADTPTKKLDDLGLTLTERCDLQSALDNLAFLSAPLAGLTSHLNTVIQGSHVKPNLRNAYSGDIIPIKEAQRDRAGFTRPRIQLMDIETDVTPYGTAVKPSDTKHSLYKPVAQGQFRFTKLNIIDKFGQAIHAICPTPQKSLDKLEPCLSQWYSPQPKKDTFDIPNVIEPNDPDERRCEFIQVPPQINQTSRLNTVFVMPGDSQLTRNLGPDKTAYWRPANEWENPIWGWIVINYANYGIQLFLRDGTFYREVRLAGVDGSLESPEWLPFGPNMAGKEKDDIELLQLKLLVEQLLDKNYLNEFVGMINKATGSMLPGPDSYAEFTNALVGRPLALVNAGWSLELAEDAYESQAEHDVRIDQWLLPDPVGKEERHLYTFPMKLGDVQRNFDGLIGYFKAFSNPKMGNALDLKTFYTHFMPDKDNSANAQGAKHITPSSYEKLRATWINPEGLTADEYDEKRNADLQIFGTIIDPFSPVHTYTGIVPVKELSLPPWTWQSAMSQMKAFFHTGPVLVTQDVPEYEPSRKLVAGAPLFPPEKTTTEKGVALPAVASGDWAWLQPYAGKEKSERRVRGFHASTCGH